MKSGILSLALRYAGVEYAGRDKAGKCPFCGGNRFFADDNKGIFTCNSNACGKRGGVINFAMELFPTASSKKEAMDQLEKAIGIDNNFKPQKIEKAYEPKECSIERRNAVYRKLVQLGTLLDVDKKDLLRRGLTEEQIRKAGYISLPRTEKERLRIGSEIVKSGLVVAEVPGFELTDFGYSVGDFGLAFRKKVFNMENLSDEDVMAYLCPSYDLHGNIQYFQIAWDKRLVGKDIVVYNKKKDFAKYTMFSTPTKQYGGKAKAECGYVGKYKKIDGNIIPDLQGATVLPIIEGVLKTAVYYNLVDGKEPCIAQVGVSNYKNLEKFLKELLEVCPEITGISNCYDMDKFSNDNVRAGSDKLKELCEQYGLTYENRIWNSKYKGIDDYAFAMKMI